MLQNDKGSITPGTPGINPENPPSSEAGLMDSGGGQSLHTIGVEHKQDSDHVSITRDNNQNVLKDHTWKMANPKKRHRLSPEERISKQFNKTKQIKMDYWLNPVVTPNKFNLLDTDDDFTQDNSTVDSVLSAEVKQIKPPPIFVAGVGDINPLLRLLDDIAPGKYFVRVINHSEIKIQAKTIEAYDLIIKALKDKNTEFHSYQKKQDKPFKVVLRNIHQSSDLNLLKNQIEEYGHIVINISNIR